jgi:Spy/CpxP family protein refolding chaperone
MNVKLAFVVTVSLLMPAIAAAQDSGQQPPKPPGQAVGQPPSGGSQVTPPVAAGPRRTSPLSEEQRTALRAMQDSLRKDTLAIRDRQRAAQRTLRDALRAEALDANAVKTAMGEAAAARADMMLLNRRRQAELKKVLNPEQLRRYNMAQRMRRTRMGAEGRMMNRPGQPRMGPGREMGQGFGPMRRGPWMNQGPGWQGQPGQQGPRPWRRWL